MEKFTHKRIIHYAPAQRRKQELIAVLVVAVVALFESVLLITSHAMTPYVATESEAGSLGGLATKQSDPDASQNSYVKFGPTDFPIKISAFNPESITTNVLPNQYVSAGSWSINWSSVEPTEGDFQWQAVDKALIADQQAGKQTILRIIAGKDTPAWVYQAGAKSVSFTCQDLSNSDNCTPGNYQMPLPWDAVFESKWETFIRAFGARYNANPDIYLIEMAGWGYLGEMELPHQDPTIINTWKADGYTDSTYVNAIENITAVYRQAFPSLPTAIDVGEPLGNGVSNAMDPVVNFMISNPGYPEKVWIQNNGLRASFAAGNSITQEIQKASAVTTVGYQMFGGEDMPLDQQTGDRQTAFQVAVDDHASYVEVYPGDIADPNLQTPLQFLATAGKP